ncbi:xyloglucan endotransglucosylase/hydrolase protein A-like [Senna tora]|uniref:Xyloglucan endotransglucosylase/hydrolase protein A-like n=1 Tax=Senna tora TaxID=362788 RepID=A0A834T509_9FABA|nr:xyloglucan endotransglucosylase/hydrolase protein A-like [Senna tora]
MLSSKSSSSLHRIPIQKILLVRSLQHVHKDGSWDSGSAGTVTAFYSSSQNSEHDEIDFKEQRIYLWFDPSKEYHIYSILWNPDQIVFSSQSREEHNLVESREEKRL